jgi:Skp family chaperone for outer membrane proteins
VKQTLLLTLLLLLSSAAYAETYRWVNEEGVVTYSQTPPPDIQAETVDIKTSPTKGAVDSQKKLEELQQKMADSAEDRELKKAQKREQAEIKAENKKNCNAARINLEQLTALGNRLYKTEDGYVRLTEETRQKKMQQAREQIKEYCKR